MSNPAVESSQVPVEAQPLRWRRKLSAFRFWCEQAYWWLPAALTLLIVRYRVERPVLSEDEAITWDASTRSVRQLFGLTSNTDAVIAPYYFFMHFWIRLFGDSEAALRTPSILAVSAAVGVTAVLAGRLFSPKVGLLTGLLLVIIPAVTRYGQDARPYGFAMFFAAVATLLLFRALDRPSWGRWASYGLSVALLGLFQLLGLLLLLGHAAALMFRFWAERQDRSGDSGINRRVYLGWVLATGGGLLPVIPVALVGLSQRNSQLWWIPPMKWDAFQSLPNDLFWSPVIGWFLVGVVLFFIAGNDLLAHGYRRMAVYQLAAITVLPSFGLYVMSFVSPSWVPRYVIYTLTSWCLLAAVAAATSKRRIALVFGLVLLVAAPTQQYLRLSISHDQPDYRAAMSVISENYQANDGLIYEPRSAWKVRPEVRYYLREDRPKDVLAVSSPTKNNTLYAKECLNQRVCLQNVPRVWVFRFDRHDSALDDYVGPAPDAIKRDYVVSKTWHPSETTVELYVRKTSV